MSRMFCSCASNCSLVCAARTICWRDVTIVSGRPYVASKLSCTRLTASDENLQTISCSHCCQREVRVSSAMLGGRWPTTVAYVWRTSKHWWTTERRFNSDEFSSDDACSHCQQNKEKPVHVVARNS